VAKKRVAGHSAQQPIIVDEVDKLLNSNLLTDLKLCRINIWVELLDLET
jgi:hypothetical protein